MHINSTSRCPEPFLFSFRQNAIFRLLGTACIFVYSGICLTFIITTMLHIVPFTRKLNFCCSSNRFFLLRFVSCLSALASVSHHLNHLTFKMHRYASVSFLRSFLCVSGFVFCVLPFMIPANDKTFHESFGSNMTERSCYAIHQNGDLNISRRQGRLDLQTFVNQRCHTPNDKRK